MLTTVQTSWQLVNRADYEAMRTFLRDLVDVQERTTEQMIRFQERADALLHGEFARTP